MIGIARLGTNDLDRAKSFYDRIFTVAGIKPLRVSDEACMWGTAGEPLFGIGKPFNGEPASVGNGTMIAVALDSRAKVDAIHSEGLALGGKDEGAPGVRGDAVISFYAAYLRDLDGHKICFFHRGQA